MRLRFAGSNFLQGILILEPFFFCQFFDRKLPRHRHVRPLVYHPQDFLLEKLARNHDITRIKAIGGCAQVRTSSLAAQRFCAHPLLSTLSSGGNPHRYPPSPPLTHASPCTPNYPQTHSHSPTHPSHKTRLHTRMHSRSRHCSVAQI